MEKIKIIDLLNKIANDEKMPFLIKFGELYYEYDKKLKDYVHFTDDFNATLFQYGIRGNDLNKTVNAYYENSTKDIIELLDEMNNLCREIKDCYKTYFDLTSDLKETLGVD